MTDSSDVRTTVLLVEDDDQVRGFIRTLLTGDGHRVLEAVTGAEGLRLAEQSCDPVEVLLTDMLLPELSGYDLALQVRQKFPDVRIIMMTGYIEGDIVQRGVSELDAAFLDKPFQPAELRRLVREAAAARRPARETGTSSGI